jgi:hypothetical protein
LSLSFVLKGRFPARKGRQNRFAGPGDSDSRYAVAPEFEALAKNYVFVPQRRCS